MGTWDEHRWEEFATGRCWFPAWWEQDLVSTSWLTHMDKNSHCGKLCERKQLLLHISPVKQRPSCYFALINPPTIRNFSYPASQAAPNACPSPFLLFYLLSSSLYCWSSFRKWIYMSQHNIWGSNNDLCNVSFFTLCYVACKLWENPVFA